MIRSPGYIHTTLCGANRTIGLKAPSFCEFNAFGQCADPSIDHVTLLFETDALIPEVLQRNREGFYELVVLKLRLGVLILRARYVDDNVDHSQVGVTKTRIWIGISTWREIWRCERFKAGNAE